MFITIVIKALLLAILVFFVIKFILNIKFNLAIRNKLGFIRPENLDKIQSIKFKWLTGPKDKLYTLNSFELPTDEKLKNYNQKLRVNKKHKNKFDLLLDDKIIVSRECLIGYEYTNLGCSKITECQGKDINEFVIDKSNRYVIHKCDGKNNVLESHTCYPNTLEDYKLPYACGVANVCFDKENGFAQPNTNKRTYSYLICQNGMLIEKQCDKYVEYFDKKKSRCVLAPVQCRQLKAGESLVLPDYTVCYKNEDGSLNVQIYKFDENKVVECSTVGNCNDKFSHSSKVSIPKLWTSSQFYKKCVNNFWTIHFCDGTKNSPENSQRNKLVEEIQNSLPDGILFTLPSIDHISVFDEKHQTCVPFEYTKHYKDQQLPLLYTDPFMLSDSEAMPCFFYDYAYKKTIMPNGGDESVNSLRLNDNYNSFNDQKPNENMLYDTKDKTLCSKNYTTYLDKNGLSIFLGVLTTVYDNVILSCRLANPVNKIIIDKNEEPNLWGRTMLTDNKYKLSNGRVLKCGKGKMTHKFIPTCVDKRCTRADFIYPLNYSKTYPALGVTYSGIFSFCSRAGNSFDYIAEETLVENSKLENILEKYCFDKTPGYWVHPYLNTPLICKENKKGEIANGLSIRDPKLDTLTIEPDSIFENDINALHLHFLRGENGI